MSRTPASFLVLAVLLSALCCPRSAWSDYEVNRYSNRDYSFSPDVKQLAWPESDEIKGAPLSIVIGTSQVLRFDRPIVRTAISDTGICDIVPLGRDEILVYSKQAGRMNLLLWDEESHVASYTIESTVDTHKLEYLLRNIDPDAELKIVPFQKTVAIYGSTSNKQDKDRIEQVTKAFDGSSLNFVGIKNAKQVLLEVRFAEVNRRDNESFKLDAEFLGRFVSARSLTGQTGASDLETFSTLDNSYPGYSATASTDTPKTTLDSGGSVITSNNITQSVGNLAMTYITHQSLITPVLNWLETKNVLKIIARPNLLAKDGEEASFLVGGKFAIPVSNNGNVSIEYQDYGTKLTFTPEVLDGDLMRIKVNTEVSELDYSNTVTISSTTVPSVLKREQKTVVELKDNQTLVIGGMLTQRVNRINMKVPFFGDLPVLKALFASESFTRTDVELLVVITPHIVEPFELEEKKEFYNATEVGKALRVIEPPYADAHGDAVQNLITQNETKAFFDNRQEAQTKGRVPSVLAPFTPSDAYRYSAPKPAVVRTEDSNLPSSPLEGNRGYLKGAQPAASAQPAA